MPRHANNSNANTPQANPPTVHSVPQNPRPEPMAPAVPVQHSAPQERPPRAPQVPQQPMPQNPRPEPMAPAVPVQHSAPQTTQQRHSMARQAAAHGTAYGTQQGTPHGRSPRRNAQAQGKKLTPKKHKSKLKCIVLRFVACFFTLIILLLVGIMGAITVIMYGPSPTARDLLVTSVLETSALKFIATLYFEQEEIDTILANNSVQVSDAITDTDLIQFTPQEATPDVEPLVIETVNGNTFNGKMMIIQDPSRVFVGTSADTFTGEAGMTVQEIITRHGGVGGINAGGFSDPGGVGNGGTPLGIVMSGGELLWGGRTTPYELIGIDNENKLVVGTMTPDEAISRGIRDAVSFGPALIVNGEMMEITGSGGGLNPRTAIGQRADGAMLLLVCDGRQANSIGASMSDVAEMMAQYGAVNAANLDGGSSTIMYYEDELINVSSSLYGPRDIPTAFVIAP